MCGFTGILSLRGSPYKVETSLIRSMTEAIKHRGPDGEGFWISPDHKVGFGFRRLAILDLSDAASQPMSNEKGDIHLVFNGEIYNHRDIRKELSHAHFKTSHSDTEVILKAYEEWGIDCIHRFRGMFAIAIWDARTRELWLVRDRIGVKPLYFSIHHGKISFASEIKALLQDPDQKREVSEEALYHYLSFLTTPAPQTLFEGIKKLPPGTWLRVQEEGAILEKKYWDVWDHTKPLINVSEDQICEQILEELKVAVSLRKESDVPVGIFLSGGVDSSANAALFSENERVKTFSVGYDKSYGSYQSELPFAKKMADSIQATYHEKVLNQEDLLFFLPEMIRFQDEPIADPVCMPVYYVSKLARENGIIVAQLGEGADELFFGYPRWKKALKLQKISNLPGSYFLKKLSFLAAHKMGKQSSFKYEKLRRSCLGIPLFWSGAEAFTEGQKKTLLSKRMKEKVQGLSSWSAIEPIYQRFLEKAWEVSPANWMSYADLSFRLPELLLMRVDKMSMAVSLEGRVPFLDHKLVELAMSIPQSMKIKGTETKRMLKKALKGVLPKELLDRPKQGFGVPIYEWTLGKLGDQMKQDLCFFCDHTDFLDKQEVMKILKEGNAPQMWNLYNLALWWKEYIHQK